MKLRELTLGDKDQFNQFVAGQTGGSFLQSWIWGGWQEQLGRPVFRFFLLADSGEVIGSLQVVKSPLPLGRFYIYAPYGPVVENGFQFSTADFQFLVQELRQRFGGAVFLRLEPKQKLPGFEMFGKKSLNIQPGKTLVVDLTPAAQELLAHMHPKTRYNIRLAQKHGVEVSSDLAVVPGHGLYFGEALDLIMQTAGRQEFQTFSRSYYQELLDFFGRQGTAGDLKVYVYKALLQKQLLAAAIILDFGVTRSYLFGGSSAHRREVMAPYALHWQAMQDAKAMGLKFYDFWGVETAAGDAPGFVRFKLGFGGQVAAYPGARDKAFDWRYGGYHTLRRINRTWIFVKNLSRWMKK
ncbi:MAG: peptidoglycan bridge formation glycyltransferase FemA/FemB family protein [Patescibacteria group bacterium]|nr:peptidoglycan bridge formation glycyltransferase FemA/FemB family protein [Patescibacteria group bacterium]